MQTDESSSSLTGMYRALSSTPMDRDAHTCQTSKATGRSVMARHVSTPYQVYHSSQQVALWGYTALKNEHLPPYRKASPSFHAPPSLDLSPSANDFFNLCLSLTDKALSACSLGLVRLSPCLLLITSPLQKVEARTLPSAAQ